MLTGVELITYLSVGQIAELQPPVVKCRWPEMLPEIVRACPNAKILTRPPTEGLHPVAIHDGYTQWLQAFTRLGQGYEKWLAHEISNEPNHPNHGMAANTWMQNALDGLTTIFFDGGGGIVPTKLLTPGLVPYVDIAHWAEAARFLIDQFPFLGRAAHLYTPWDIGDVWAQLQGGLAGAFITEAGISMASCDERVVDNVANFKRAKLEGIACAILFSHDGGNEGEFNSYVCSLENQRKIIFFDGSEPPVPDPIPEPAPEPGPSPTSVNLGDIYNDWTSARENAVAFEAVPMLLKAANDLGWTFFDERTYVGVDYTLYRVGLCYEGYVVAIEDDWTDLRKVTNPTEAWSLPSFT
jgi:hypothetical protein